MHNLPILRTRSELVKAGPSTTLCYCSCTIILSDDFLALHYIVDKQWRPLANLLDLLLEFVILVDNALQPLDPTSPPNLKTA